MQFETKKAAERRSLPRRLVSTNPAMREKAEASACPPKPGEGWKRRLVRPGAKQRENIEHPIPQSGTQHPMNGSKATIGSSMLNARSRDSGVGCWMFIGTTPNRSSALLSGEKGK
jgi:hypothetical protein